MKCQSMSGWRYYKKGIISIFPPYYEVDVDKRALFKHFKRAFYIRWDSDFDKVKNPYYYHIVKDDGCEMESLPPKTRNQIRRCLNNCRVFLVEYDFIIEGGGYDVYATEYKRYEKKGYGTLLKSYDKWVEGMTEAAQRGQEFWAVMYGDKLIAYSICKRWDSHVDLVTWKADYEKYNHLYPSYGLVYTMLNYYFSQNGVLFVDDGGRSLTEHSGVQVFLCEKFCFRKAYTKLNAVFKWYLYIPLFFLSFFEDRIRHNQLCSLIRLYKWSR